MVVDESCVDSGGWGERLDDRKGDGRVEEGREGERKESKEGAAGGGRKARRRIQSAIIVQ